MKFLLLLSLISFSRFSFSAEKSDIVQATQDSLLSHDLNCISDEGVVFKGSKVDLSPLDYNDYKMTINEKQQPVITFLLVDYKNFKE